MSAALSFSHGANDAQKSMGVIAALLIATGHLDSITVPLWVKLSCGAALTLGTATGRLAHRPDDRPPDLPPRPSSTGSRARPSSTAVILASSFVGAPVSTTQVVASSVVGVGGGRRRWRHVRWVVVREMGFAWLLTIPATAALGGRGRRRLECARMSRRWFLPETPGRARDAARADGDHRRGDGRARRLGRRATPLRPTASATASTAPTSASARCGGADGGVHDAARAGGPVRALARPRRRPERREGHRARGGGDGRRARRGDGADGDAAGRRRAATLQTRSRASPAPDATEPADAAVKSQRRLERVYREAMSALVQDSDLREVAARRELYRRISRTSDRLVEVAERVWYSVLKQR